MADLTTVARPYAKAAFEHAREKGEAAQWAKTLALLAGVVSDEQFSAYLTQPQLTATQQADAIASVCQDELDDGAKNFVQQLAENKRLAALPEIFHLYSLLYSELEQSEEVTVVSAFELTAEQEQKLVASLKKKLGKDVSLNTSIDNSLIGGVIIRAGDLVIDSSVRGKIAKLAETLNS